MEIINFFDFVYIIQNWFFFTSLSMSMQKHLICKIWYYYLVIRQRIWKNKIKGILKVDMPYSRNFYDFFFLDSPGIKLMCVFIFFATNPA